MHIINKSRSRHRDPKSKEDEAAGDGRSSTQAAAAWAWFQHGGATTARPEQAPQTISNFKSTGAAAAVRRPSRFHVETQNKFMNNSFSSKTELHLGSSSRRHSIGSSSSSSFSGNLQLQQLREEILQMSYGRSSSSSSAANDANAIQTAGNASDNMSLSNSTRDESEVTPIVNDSDGIASGNYDDSKALVELVEEYDTAGDEYVYDLININGAPKSAVSLFDSFELEAVSRRLADAMAAAKAEELQDESRETSSNRMKPVGRELTRRRRLSNMNSSDITRLHRRPTIAADAAASGAYNSSSNKAQLSGALQQLLRFRIPSTAICDSVAIVDSTFPDMMGRKKQLRNRHSHVAAKADRRHHTHFNTQSNGKHRVQLQQLQVLNHNTSSNAGEERGIVPVDHAAKTAGGHATTHFHHHFHHYYVVQTRKASKETSW